MIHSARFNLFKERYDAGYITAETLSGWVAIGIKKPERGITAEEFEEITGKKYNT